MPDAARTQRYEGLFPSQTQEMFEADAHQAATQGWYPLSETWSGTALFVVYEHDPERRTRPPQPQPAPSGPWSASAKAAADVAAQPAATQRVSPQTAKALTGLLVGMAVLAAFALAMFSFQSWDRPGTLYARPVIAATPKPVHFGDGVWHVPGEVAPGTYRATTPKGCYWARLLGPSGEARDVIATDLTDAPAIVTIRPEDYGFESTGCGKWTSRLTRITKSRARFGPGTYIMGTDFAPGIYRSSGTGLCTWARLGSFGGKRLDAIETGSAVGRQQVTIAPLDAGFTSKGCGAWTRQ